MKKNVETLANSIKQRTKREAPEYEPKEQTPKEGRT
jgi:hypothetical protein